jgi:hypothetical protein
VRNERNFFFLSIVIDTKAADTSSSSSIVASVITLNEMWSLLLPEFYIRKGNSKRNMKEGKITNKIKLISIVTSKNAIDPSRLCGMRIVVYLFLQIFGVICGPIKLFISP